MNSKLQCIIVDDEIKDRENLKLLLNTYCPYVDIIGEAYNENSIIDLLSSSEPDLVFMDIQLGSQSVFDVLSKLESINFTIVFVSAYDKYAIEGYQYNAIDYLLKPINPEKLIKVVEKVKTKKDSNPLGEDMLAYVNDAIRSINTNSKISIADSKGVHLVDPNLILYCIGDGNYTTFKLLNDKNLIVSKNLKYFQEKLAPFRFLRVHKSYLINLDQVKLLIKEQGGTIEMSDGTHLPISRIYKKTLYRKLGI